MPTQTELGDLVATIYDAALDRTRWSEVLERIADSVQAQGSALIMQHRQSGRGEGIFSRVDPASHVDYFRHFAAINPLIPASEHLRSGAVTTDRDIVPRDQFVRSEYFRDFLLPNDMSSMLSLTVLREGDNHCAFNFCRRPGREEHGQAQVALAGSLMPHLQRAFAISIRLAQAEAGLGASAGVLDRLACGVVVFDASGAVMHANAAAERIAAANDGFSLGQRGVAAPGVDLPAAVLRAARHGEGASLLLRRTSGGHGVSALVVPLRHEPVWLWQRPAALLILGDPDAPANGVEARLGALYKLTAAEANVAAQLMTGASPQEIGARLGIGMPTVRQHLSRTLAKTGTTRQAELVHLLLRTVGALD
jgi:DNA-binding CsgD family transcriptional regulator/PAS domain-containing protein